MKTMYDSENPRLPVEYLLPLGSEEVLMNELIGSVLRLEYDGMINCVHCGREIKKSFAQGYCYPCFMSLPQTDACVLHPEKCQAHLGISRDMIWSADNCLQDHFVYLALSPGIKVGVTRKSQVPARWIDQGAGEAIRLALTPNRFIAGSLEVELKKHLPDKTNWRHMLTGIRSAVDDLGNEKKRAFELLPEEMKKYKSDDNRVYSIRYPVSDYPEKVKTLNFDKDRTVEGILRGIKGQYLIFDNGNVLNIRRFGGYMINLYY